MHTRPERHALTGPTSAAHSGMLWLLPHGTWRIHSTKRQQRHFDTDVLPLLLPCCCLQSLVENQGYGESPL